MTTRLPCALINSSSGISSPSVRRPEPVGPGRIWRSGPCCSPLRASRPRTGRPGGRHRSIPSRPCGTNERGTLCTSTSTAFDTPPPPSIVTSREGFRGKNNPETPVPPLPNLWPLFNATRACFKKNSKGLSSPNPRQSHQARSFLCFLHYSAFAFPSMHTTLKQSNGSTLPLRYSPHYRSRTSARTLTLRCCAIFPI
jgi:hypothetical protein